MQEQCRKRQTDNVRGAQISDRGDRGVARQANLAEGSNDAFAMGAFAGRERLSLFGGRLSPQSPQSAALSRLSRLNALRAKRPCTLWVLDSGASHHITGDLSLLTDVRAADVHITFANGQWRRAENKGEVLLELQGATLKLHDVLYISGAPANLLSVRCVRCLRLFSLRSFVVVSGHHGHGGHGHAGGHQLRILEPAYEVCLFFFFGG